MTETIWLDATLDHRENLNCPGCGKTIPAGEVGQIRYGSQKPNGERWHFDCAEQAKARED